jgi:hypothetical protein
MHTWPERWVPPPPTRGIRATARPVPQDSALVWWPAFSLTAYACRLFLAMLSVRINQLGVLTDMSNLALTVHLLDDIEPDGSGQNCWKRKRG